MDRIKLKHDPHGDNRHAPADTTFEQFHQANLSHIKDVQDVMTRLSIILDLKGKSHDTTKLTMEQQFFKDFKTLTPEQFINGEWYQMHVHTERHHPFAYCHDDITLLDILETIVDCTCAGKARSGVVRPLEFNQEILEKAVKNTVKLIDDMTEVDYGK